MEYTYGPAPARQSKKLKRIKATSASHSRGDVDKPHVAEAIRVLENANTYHGNLESSDADGKQLSLFTFLSGFDLILKHYGFDSLDYIPIVTTEHATDPAFEQLRKDVTEYLQYPGKRARKAAPFLRELLQLTGYGGSNVHKFKPVEDATAEKYAVHLSTMLILLRELLKAPDGTFFSHDDRNMLRRQTEKYDSLKEQSRTDHEVLRSVHNILAAVFSMLLLRVYRDQASTYDMVLAPLLAIMGVTSSNQGTARRMRTASEMSHGLASLLYCMSCTALYRIQEKMCDVNTIRATLSLEKNTAYAFVRDILDKTRGDRLAEIAPIRFRTCMNPEHQPAGSHPDDACGVLNDVHLSLGTVRKFLIGIEDEMERIMQKELLLGLPKHIGVRGKELRLMMRDRITDATAGTYFASLPTNLEAAHGCAKALLAHVLDGTVVGTDCTLAGTRLSPGDNVGKSFLAPPDLAEETIIRFGDNALGKEAVNGWLQSTQHFLQHMLVYVYLSGGGPSRATEIGVLRYRNGLNDERNVYLDETLVSIVYRYNKTRNLFERSKQVARFLSAKASSLLVIYLLYVRPVENMMVRCTVGEKTTESKSRCVRHNELLFAEAGHVYNGDKIRHILNKFLSQMVQAPGFGISQWRHYQNHMEVEFMSDSTAVDVARPDKDCPFVAIYKHHLRHSLARDPTQAGHTLQTAEAIYGQSDAYPHGYGSTLYMQHRVNSARWHKMLGICCESWRCHRADGSFLPEVDSQVRCTPAAAIDTASLAREIVQVIQRQVQHGEKRKITNELCGLPVAGKHSKRAKQVGHASFNVLSTLKELLSHMRSLLQDDKARFRNMAQLQFVHQALARNTDILVVLPTGSGKTLLYLLTAYIEANRAREAERPAPVTILIAATKALVQDVLRRSQSLGVQAANWSGRDNPQVFVIVLAVEHTKGPAY